MSYRGMTLIPRQTKSKRARKKRIGHATRRRKARLSGWWRKQA